MFLLFVTILDFSRIYTTMASVESAAREAADFGTEGQGAVAWSKDNIAGTVAEMRRRACVAASDLPDYVGIDTSVPPDGVDDDCSNPTFSYCIRQSSAATCDFPVDPTAVGYTCDQADREPPCRITVTMAHQFHLFVPFQLDFFGVKLGLPVTLSFERDSTFAMTDIEATETSSP